MPGGNVLVRADRAWKDGKFIGFTVRVYQKGSGIIDRGFAKDVEDLARLRKFFKERYGVNHVRE